MAGQTFFDIRDIQTNCGVVIGNIGDTVYRHGYVECFLKAVKDRGWMMIAERLRCYVERIQGNTMVPSSGDLVETLNGEELHKNQDSDLAAAILNDSVLSEPLTPNSDVSAEQDIVTPLSLLDTAHCSDGLTTERSEELVRPLPTELILRTSSNTTIRYRGAEVQRFRISFYTILCLLDLTSFLLIRRSAALSNLPIQ